MINVSNEFWRLMHERTDFKENAEITFKDGTVLELDESVFTMDNNSVTDAAGVNSIPLGVALSRSIQIELQNDDERFSIYDFFGATIRLYLKFELSESVEKIEYGRFTVVSPATYGETVIITANDDMWKSDVAYSTSITFPAQAWEVLQDSCATCGISLSTTEFLNNDFEIQEKPSSDYTHRQIIGYIAMIACGNARINRQGYLEILSYDFSFLNEIADGGTFNPWTGGYVADGGTFNPWTEGDVLDGGLFTDRKDYHILYNFKDSPRVDTDDVVITGVQTTIQPKDSEEQSRTVLLGQEGYILKVENPLIDGNEENALQRIGAIMIDGRMRSFEGDHIAYPIAEFMDKAFVVDRKGNTYGTILTDINFTFFGFTTFKNSAENAVRNASSFGSQGTQAIIKAQQMVKQEKKARELAVKKLSQALANSSGMYITEELQEDWSIIYYAHDKKTLEESQFVWKFTAEAIGISTDGGETYPYGFMVTGEMITKILSTEGINADWINTGTLKSIKIISDDPSTLFSTQIRDGVIYTYGSKDGNAIRTGWINSFKSESDTSENYDGWAFVLSNDADAIAFGIKTDGSSFNTYYYINNGYNPGGATERHVWYGEERHKGYMVIEDGISCYGTAICAKKLGLASNGNTYGTDYRLWCKGNAYISDAMRVNGSIHCYGAAMTAKKLGLSEEGGSYNTYYMLSCEGDAYIDGDFGVGGTKSRIANTENYNKRHLYCYEMPSPIFGDVGHGVTGEDGLCYIDIDQVFFETVNMNQSYQVFLQSYSEHNVFVLKKEPQYFVVKGTPNTEFDWELKAKQLDFPNHRLEEIFTEDNYEETDYVALADEYLNQYEQEVLNYG